MHVRPARENGENRLAGQVSFIRDLGASVEITVRCGEKEVLAVTTPRDRPGVQIGDPVAVELPAAACVVLAVMSTQPAPQALRLPDAAVEARPAPRKSCASTRR